MRAQSSCCADLPSLGARSPLHVVGEGRGGKTWLGSATLLGLALQTGPQRPAVALGLGKAWVCLRSEWGCAQILPRRKVLSAHGRVFGFTFLPRVLETLTFKRESLPCGFMSVILGFKLFMHEKLLRSCILPCMNNDYMGTQITAVLH